ncbi:hypothetical protein CVIRNUC_009618 [Coccomyxa viridis]|uniref:alpha-1,2-Mannosidase n=1 Tax=Coccomyxa viridis TaxID=1274662 RepID=A0AAV1IJM1_9CHLO|nr:hypothetical protein CVIRNUC_009618 [Coccomyxa viridis]
MKSPLFAGRHVHAVPKKGYIGIFVGLLILWAYAFHYSGHSIRVMRPQDVQKPKLHIKVSGRARFLARQDADTSTQERMPQPEPSQAILGRAVGRSAGPGWGWAVYEHGKMSAKEAALWAGRQAEVKKAVQHSWQAYEAYAWGFDELLPLNKSARNSFGGLGATIVDSLDTLHLLGMRAEFKRARNWVAKELDLDHGGRLSLFETIIRIVGGLISAFDASRDKLFLEKAVELADKLQLSFPEGGQDHAVLPSNDAFLLPGSGEATRAWAAAPDTVGLAEAASFMVEWHALAARTGNASYAVTADHVVHLLQQRHPKQAFLPVWFNMFTATTNPGNTFCLGGMSDSYYEYLLKVWLLKSKQADVYRDMWERAMDGALEKLLQMSSDGSYFVGSVQVPKSHKGKTVFVRKMEHLACYLPGNLALGVAEGAVGGEKAVQYAAVAEELAHTCMRMYKLMPTGLAPEKITFLEEGGTRVDAADAGNVLRPETVESLYYMWRLTGEQRYQEWGWSIFQAFQEHAKGDVGYHSLLDVTKLPAVPSNGMESFWIAETLKYLWLLFGEPSALPLDKWVLSTEAHPFLLDAAVAS